MKDQAKAQVMKLMRTLIDKNTENKECGWLVEQASHNSPITVADCYSIIKNIPEGTSGNTRLGDKIRPKSLVVRGVVSLNPGFQPDTKPLYVRVIIATQKDVKVAGSTTTTVDADHLLRPADAALGSEVAFDGTRTTLNFPVNNNKFRVYMDKIYALCPTSAASGFPLNQYAFRFQKKFKKLPASLTYDAGNGDYCNNFAPFLAVGYCYQDGSAADTLTTRISTSIHSILGFEDA